MGRRTDLAQTSFLSGALDPKLKARTDVSHYYNGGEFMQNVAILPQGGFTRRPGTFNVAEIQGPVTKIDLTAGGIVVTMPEGGTSADVIDDNDDTLAVTTTNIGVIDPYVAVHIDLLTATAIEFCDAANFDLDPFTVLSNDEWVIQHSPDDAVWTDAGTKVNIVGSRQQYRRWRSAISRRYWRFVRIGTTDLTTAKMQIGEIRLWSLDAAPATNPSRVIDFEASNASLFEIVLTDNNAAIYMRDDSTGTPVFTRVADVYIPHLGTDLKGLQWFQAQDFLFLFHIDHRVFQVVRAGDDVQWQTRDWIIERQATFDFEDLDNPIRGNNLTLSAVAGNAITVTAASAVFTAAMVGWAIEDRRKIGFGYITAFTSSTVVTVDTSVDFNSTTVRRWALLEIAWSDARGWPRAGAYGNGRLFVGGTKAIPNGVWASKSAILNDFDDSEALDTSAMTLLVDTKNTPAVYSIFNSVHVQVLTSRGVFYYAPTDAAITPKTVNRRVAASVGAEGPGIPVDGTEGGAIFVQRRGKSVRELVFTDAANPYIPANLGLLVPSLIRQPIDAALRKTAATDEGDWYGVVNSDGNPSIMQFVRDQEIVAWTEWRYDGLVQAISADIDYFYFVVQRTLSGTKRWFLERADPLALLDNGVSAGPGVPANEVVVGAYLEGETIHAYVDKIDLGTFTVTGGKITLVDDVETLAEVGLEWPDLTGNGDILRFIDMPAEIPGGPATIRPREKRVVDVDLILHETQDVWVGANGEAVEQLIFRAFGEGLLDEPPPITTGVESREGIEGTSTEGQVELTQRAVGPLTVLGIHKKLEVMS